VALIRCRVDVRYDPFDISIIEIWHKGKFRCKAVKLDIPEFVAEQVSPLIVKSHRPTGSRLLKIYEEKNKLREKQRNGALSFRNRKKDEQI